MNYFILNENYDKLPFLLSEYILFDDEEKCIDEGKKIEDYNVPLNFYVKGSGSKDFLADGSFALVSPLFKTVLESEFTGLTYYPVEVSTLSNTSKKVSYFLPLLPVVDCFDYKLSDYDGIEEEGIIAEIRKFVLDNSRISHSAFRLKEMPYLVIINSKLKESIEKHNLVGMTFLPIEEFVFPSY